MSSHGTSKDGNPGYSRNKLSDQEIIVNVGFAQTSLSNGSGYVFGHPGTTAQGNFNYTSVIVPYDGILREIYLCASATAGGTSSGQGITFYKNGVSQGTILTPFNTTAGSVISSAKKLKFKVKKNDRLEFQFTAGAAATSVTVNGYVVIKRKPSN